MKRVPAASAICLIVGLVGGIADDDRGFGIVQEVIQLAGGVRHVERVKYQAGAEAGEIQHQHFRRLFDLDRNPVARRYAEIRQEPGQSC